VIEEIIRAKPAAAKGRYILSITLTPTMGPGIRVDSSRTRRGEIMIGAGATADDGEEPAPEASQTEAEDATEADEPAEEPATA